MRQMSFLKLPKPTPNFGVKETFGKYGVCTSNNLDLRSMNSYMVPFEVISAHRLGGAGPTDVFLYHDPDSSLQSPLKDLDPPEIQNKPCCLSGQVFGHSDKK